MKEKIDTLYSNDNNLAYKTLLELEISCSESAELYNYFDELLCMLKNEKSFIRVRGFRLICSLAAWDKDNKINNNISFILDELNDNAGTSLRQCIKYLNLILLYKPELNDNIVKALKRIDLKKYKPSMQKLIINDINLLLNNI